MNPRHPVSGLTKHLGYWLRMVSNHVSHAFARKVEARGVTVAEWVVLRALYDIESLAPGRLAEQMGMTRGAVSKLADRLIDKGLIARTFNPDDARAQILRLSPAGEQLVPELATLADENDADCFGPLTTEERGQLERLLQKIAGRRGLKDIPVS